MKRYANVSTWVGGAVVLAAFSLLLAACGGGGGGGGGASGSSIVGTQMGGARQGVTLPLATASATVSTLAGQVPTCGGITGTGGDGTGGAASFCVPFASVADGLGDLYVADTYSQTIRKFVIATGKVTTIAGQSGVMGAADGTGTAAMFAYPMGIASDGTNLYVTDSTNNKIRMIAPAGGATLATMTSANAKVTSLTGTANTGMARGAADGPASSATFASPSGIVFAVGNLYVADRYNHMIRMINLASATVSTVAGTGSAGAADGTGTAAAFSIPTGIASDGTNLYVTDAGNYKIRMIAPTGGATLTNISAASAVVNSVTGAAGVVASRGAADGAGTAATFSSLGGIATDNVNLYVADVANNKIRMIAPASGATLDTLTSASAVVSSYTGTANTAMLQGSADGAAAGATFFNPDGISADAAGALYVADTGNNTVRKIAGGQVSTLAGAAIPSDGTGAAARLDLPQFVTNDGINLYETECGATATVRKIVIATGQVITLAGSAVSGTATDGTGTAAIFNCPQGITTDGTSLYVADSGNNMIRKITPAGGSLANMTSANAVVTTVAGTGVAGSADGPGTSATFSALADLTTDGHNLFVTDNNMIRMIAPTGGATLATLTPANAVVTTVTGAVFSYPQGITTDGTNLYVADTLNYKIRMIAPTGGATLDTLTAASAVVSTVAGTGSVGTADGSGTAATFYNPQGVTTDGTHLYVTDSSNHKIRMITPSGGATLATINPASAVVTSVTGAANTQMPVGHADGAAATATFSNMYNLTTDGKSLYVVDGGNSTMRKIH